MPDRLGVPRRPDRDHTEEMADARRRFATAHSGSDLHHVSRYSFDPSLTAGNVENFLGVAQVPIGLAGPLRVEGEHAHGDFVIPLATTEGTLVASYNRGMRLLHESGGVKTTVVDDAMQRAPAFVFDDARQARAFGHWLQDNVAGVRTAAEETTSVGRLLGIGQYQVGPILYLRFNYTTGDAAGQNMTGRATLAACEWIREQYPGPADYLLSGNLDTDKKQSGINMLLTRGKRVVAEAVLDRRIMRDLMGVDTVEMFRARQVSNVGAILGGNANNGAHYANGLAALFIATGQDAANVAESHAGLTYSQLLDNGDYYWSVTLTSLIVATHGGGTGLPTQRECLELLGCYGRDKVAKFAEICAAVVLAGETSLSAAIVHGDWVSSHERYGRNR